jgi:hypothetical protein
MSKVTERLTFANVMSVIAVFIAIGGGAYAAGLAKNSVKSKQIAAGAVKKSELASGAVVEKKVAGGAVSTEKIGDGAVTTDKIADNAVTGAKVDEGSLGEVPLATEARNTLGAIVNLDGSLSSSAQPGTTSTRNGVGTGFYTVDFGRSLSNCAAVASLGNNLSNIPNPGEIGATINFDDTVTVQTRNSAGTATDNGFQLIVVC